MVHIHLDNSAQTQKREEREPRGLAPRNRKENLKNTENRAPGASGAEKPQTKLHKAFKAAVEPAPETIEKLWLLSRTLVHLWNMGVVQAERWLEKKEKAVTAYSFNYWLTGMRAFSVQLADGTRVALSAISVDVEREVLRKLAGSYKSFFELKKNKDGRARMPWTRTEDRFMTMSWSSFSVQGGLLLAPGFDKKRIEIPVGDYLAEKIAGKDAVHATLAFRDGRFELSLVAAFEAPPPRSGQPAFFRAIDLGAGDIAVSDSDGSEFLIPARRPDKFWRGEVRSIAARVEGRQKGSRGWKRLMKARRHILNKSSDQHSSHQRKLAHALLEDKIHCIVIGKPKTRLGLARSKSGTSDEHWGVQNTGYMFRQILYIKEKAAERGVKVVELADPIREGGSDDPLAKFNAARTLLSAALAKSGLPMPGSFVRKHFCFKQ